MKMWMSSVDGEPNSAVGPDSLAPTCSRGRPAPAASIILATAPVALSRVLSSSSLEKSAWSAWG